MSIEFHFTYTHRFQGLDFKQTKQNLKHTKKKFVEITLWNILYVWSSKLLNVSILQINCYTQTMKYFSVTENEFVLYLPVHDQDILPWLRCHWFYVSLRKKNSKLNYHIQLIIRYSLKSEVFFKKCFVELMKDNK